MFGAVFSGVQVIYPMAMREPLLDTDLITMLAP
jgi:hypothetical protein